MFRDARKKWGRATAAAEKIQGEPRDPSLVRLGKFTERYHTATEDEREAMKRALGHPVVGELLQQSGLGPSNLLSVSHTPKPLPATPEVPEQPASSHESKTQKASGEAVAPPSQVLEFTESPPVITPGAGQANENMAASTNGNGPKTLMFDDFSNVGQINGTEFDAGRIQIQPLK